MSEGRSVSLGNKLGDLASKLSGLKSEVVRGSGRDRSAPVEPRSGDAAGRLLSELELMRFAVLNLQAALTGSVPEPPDWTELNPMSVVESLLPLVAREAAEAKVSIRFDPDHERNRLPAIWLEVAGFRRAVHNVLIHALRQTRAAGTGEVVIRCRRAEPSPPLAYTKSLILISYPEAPSPKGTLESLDIEIPEARRCLNAQGGELRIDHEAAADPGQQQRTAAVLVLPAEGKRAALDPVERES